MQPRAGGKAVSQPELAACTWSSPGPADPGVGVGGRGRAGRPAGRARQPPPSPEPSILPLAPHFVPGPRYEERPSIPLQRGWR